MSQPSARARFNESVSAQERLRLARLVVLAVLGLTATAWIPWFLALGWWLLLAVMTGKLSDKLLEAVIAKWGAERSFVVHLLTASWCGLCALAYNALWWMVWPHNPFAALLLGCICQCMLMLNAANYMTFLRAELYTYLVPGFASMALLPVLTRAEAPLEWFGAACATLLVMIGVIFFADRGVLVKQAARSELMRLHAVEQNRAKTQFLTTITHELRTPLNIIIGNAGLLEEELLDQGLTSEKEDAAKITRSANDLLHLINAAIDFEALEFGQLTLHVTDVDLEHVIRGAAAAAMPAADRNSNALITTIEGPLGRARLDGARLTQCVSEMLSNACKFTQNGRVELCAQLLHHNSQTMLKVSVSDSGPGIAEEAVKNLFQPFVQADSSLTRKHDGAGLGLALVHRLVAAMQGSISVDTKLGRGTKFVMNIPLAHALVEAK